MRRCTVIDGRVPHAILGGMYALTHDLARRRILYPRPLLTLPDVLLFDIPACFAHPSLPLGRYYPIIIENGAEQREVEVFLSGPREAPVQPDLLDRRPSGLETGGILLAIYSPPEPGWPHLLLCHWPSSYVALTTDPDLFARAAYTTELFEDSEALTQASRQLLAVLGESRAVQVTLLAATTPSGRA